MLHSPEILEKQREHMGQRMTDIAVGKSSAVAASFWDIVENRLAALEDIPQARFYVEGNDTRKEFAKGGVDNRLSGDNIPPEEKVISEFMLRIGGVLEPFEDKALIGEQLEVYKELDRLMSTADEKDLEMEQSSAMKETMVQTATDLLKKVFAIGKRGQQLSDRRDEYMAKRIAESLQEGETGFLFLGGSHSVPSLIPQDIQVELLDERLPGMIKEVVESRKSEEDEDEPFESFGGNEMKG